MTQEEHDQNGRTADGYASRRQYLRLTGAVGVASIAGCQDSSGGDGETATSTETATESPTATATEDSSGGLATNEDQSASADIQSTLIATWRGTDPTSSITLQWLAKGDGAQDSVPVTLSPTGADGSTSEVETGTAQFGDSEIQRHRAEPTDLQPDTEYRVQIGDTDLDPVIRTAPETLTAPITFAEGGDLGSGGETVKLHEQAAEWDPLFAFVGGDLAYADGVNTRKWLSFLDMWNENMRSGDRLIPIVAAIGDHEVAASQNKTTNDPSDAPFFNALFDNPEREQAYWAFDAGDYLSMLVLDSTQTAAVGGAQTRWLDKRLTERTDRQHLMAAKHIPAYPSAKAIHALGTDAIREHWVPLFEEYDVDIVFEHDGHAYKRTHRLRGGETDAENGIQYVGDGGWGQHLRDPKSTEERPYLKQSEGSHNVLGVTIRPDGTRSVRAVDPDGNTIDEFEQ
ncbi:hypothetical protein BRC91_08220 [Halobacteriales archaeon QS_4_62_28]|nr:MAG: hypothetical protein BRC91_08220 [Halobacteriales archaeon QS_4_62_28]